MTSIFRSVKFNVVLFLVIALLAALGTLIPQTTDSSEKVAALVANHPLAGRWLGALGFFDVYHMPIFAALLGLMAFDVVVCKLVNKPPDPGLVVLPEEASRDDVTLQALRKKPHRLDGATDASVDAAAKTLTRALKKNRYHLKTTVLPGGGLAIAAVRHRLQRWGSYVSHISLVLILLGAVMKSLWGFETFLPILEGRSASVSEPILSTLRTSSLKGALLQRSLAPIKNWELQVDKLTVEFYRDSTTPSTFASRVKLTDNDRTLADTVIRVNQPLDVNHVRFYQASWGVTGMVRGAVLNAGGRTFSTGMKEFFPVPNAPVNPKTGRRMRWRGRVEHYLPDFTIGQDGQPSTASLEWKHPAVVVGLYNEGGQQMGTFALGAPSPAAPDEKPWGFFFMGDSHMPVQPPINVLSVDPVLFSGVQVSYDPGFPVIVTGVISMLLGLCALFYLHQRRVLVFLRPQDNGGARIEAGGWSSRGADFESEFRAIFRPLRLEA